LEALCFSQNESSTNWVCKPDQRFTHKAKGAGIPAYLLDSPTVYSISHSSIKPLCARINEIDAPAIKALVSPNLNAHFSLLSAILIKHTNALRAVSADLLWCESAVYETSKAC